MALLLPITAQALTPNEEGNSLVKEIAFSRMLIDVNKLLLDMDKEKALILTGTSDPSELLAKQLQWTTDNEEAYMDLQIRRKTIKLSLISIIPEG